MKALSWVIGEGGLLGSQVRRALDLRSDAFQPWDNPERPFTWRDPSRLLEQFDASVDAFDRETRDRSIGWAVFWCAGVGVVGADQGVLDVERRAFQRLLDRLGRGIADPDRGTAGLVFFASSGGAVYGDCQDRPITEASATNPLSAYGHHKIAMENLLDGWAESRPMVSTLIGRISNLYGVGQDPKKPQGLISHISRSLIFQKHLNIFVPLDTIRDYLFVEDCARSIVACVAHLQSEVSDRPAPRILKIFASGETASVAQILGIFAALLRHRPSFVCHVSPTTKLQPRNLRFHSAVLRDVEPTRQVGLHTGIRTVHQSNVSEFMKGRIRPSMSRNANSRDPRA